MTVARMFVFLPPPKLLFLVRKASQGGVYRRSAVVEHEIGLRCHCLTYWTQHAVAKHQRSNLTRGDEGVVHARAMLLHTPETEAT